MLKGLFALALLLGLGSAVVYKHGGPGGTPPGMSAGIITDVPPAARLPG